jgi:hypothetical protein
VEVTWLQKRELTPAQKEYRRYDTRRGIIIKTLIVFLVAILVCFVTAFCNVDEDPAPLLFCLGILIVYTVITIFVCLHLARKHGQLYVAAYGNDTDVIHNGLFGELWQEFEWNQFEGLTDGKVVFAETHNNTIDLQILRKEHEFDICIDCEAIYMICDEETDAPIEKEIPLSDFKDVGEVFFAIREFIEINS